MRLRTAHETWIKPSFLWLMERSGWGNKSGQERILAVRITRAGWDEALALGVLTSWDRRVHATHAAWRATFDAAQVHVSPRYVRDWIVSLEDLTPLVRKLRERRASERARFLPRERPYPVESATARRLGMAS